MMTPERRESRETVISIFYYSIIVLKVAYFIMIIYYSTCLSFSVIRFIISYYRVF